ncbi:MAG: hypothetical protein ABSA02_06275 [Trebonia sp.]
MAVTRCTDESARSQEGRTTRIPAGIRLPGPPAAADMMRAHYRDWASTSPT